MMKTKPRRERECSPYKAPSFSGLGLGKSNYGFDPLLDRVFNACDFKMFSGRPEINFLDAMSGPGKPGLAIREKLRVVLPDLQDHTRFYFNDNLQAPLAALPENSLIARCDICDIGMRFPIAFNIIAMQNGIVDLPKERQPLAFSSLYASMRPGGRLVVADLVASDKQHQATLSSFHFVSGPSAAAAPRTQDTHIPCVAEWYDLLNSAGFRNITPPYGLCTLDLSVFFSSSVGGYTAIRYHVIILAADKPYE